MSSQSNLRKWTAVMNNDLLDCKLKAKELLNSENPPRKENGRKRGYMSIMKDLWEGRGYAELKLSEQNLREQVAKLEQTLGNVEEVFLSSRNEGEVRNDQETQESQDDINSVQNVNIQNANNFGTRTTRYGFAYDQKRDKRRY